MIERHGGTVEGFAGDALVAVFGLAELHEDDALRAVRAAVELREAQPGVRLGLEAGEVFVAGGPRRSRDRRRVHRRGGAPGGGRRRRGPARRGDPRPRPRRRRRRAARRRWRLAACATPARSARCAARSWTARASGRRCSDAFARVRDERDCRLVGIVGPAGIGKSRLAHELAGELDATVVSGGCAVLRRGRHVPAAGRDRRGAGRARARRRAARRGHGGDAEGARGDRPRRRAGGGRGDLLGGAAAARGRDRRAAARRRASRTCTGRSRRSWT